MQHELFRQLTVLAVFRTGQSAFLNLLHRLVASGFDLIHTAPVKLDKNEILIHNQCFRS